MKEQMKTMKKFGEEAIFDARSLGGWRFFVLGFQHLFAMFGATVLVPLLTGLSISSTLLFAGLGTLLFHFISKKKVPAFLGSSFAFLAGYMSIAPNKEPELLLYACFGVALAGLMYLVLAFAFRIFGAGKVMRFFPPVVTGPIIIAIGLNLSKSAVENCSSNWGLALTAIVVVIFCNIFGKGMVKIIPILLGVVVSYLFAAVLGYINFEPVASASWFGFPVQYERTVFSLFTSGNLDPALLFSSCLTIIPISFATMMEHIGDISAISATTGKNFIEDPGLHRTLAGDGIATSVAALFGGPANTTYGENTGVLELSRVFDPRVIRLAALYAIVLGFVPKVSQVIGSMPSAIIGGISFILYGMISAIGVRNVVENRVDLTKSRNLIIAAVILVSGLGFKDGITFYAFGTPITLTSLAIAAIAGILLNAILPGKDYEFGDRPEGDIHRGVSFNKMPEDEQEGKAGKA